MIKSFVRCCFLVAAALPCLWWKALAPLAGRERAFQGASQFCALVPGLFGSLLRAAFYRLSLPGSSQATDIGFLSTFSHPGAVLGRHVSCGVCCNIGWVHIGNDCILASLVCIASGKGQHRHDRTDIPIRLQGGEKQLITVGQGCWIGAGAVILADVGEGSVVAAGSVVTTPVPPYSIVAGNPAKVVKTRSLPGDGALQEQAGTEKAEARIAQLTIALRMGGAERLALDLLRYGKEHNDGFIAGLYLDPGPLQSLAAAEGIESIALKAEAHNRFQQIRMLFALLRSGNVSLVHTHAEYLLPVAMPAAFLARIPLVHTMHSKHALETIPKLRFFMRVAAPFLRNIVCVTEPLRDYCIQVLRFNPAKVRVIQNGVDLKVFTPQGEKAALPWGAEEGRFVFGNVARLHEAKDLGNLVRAFAIVHARHPGTRLVLVGDGEERGALESLIAGLRLGGAVHITGIRKDIPALLRSLDMFVLSSRHEGMPMAVLEAMACGIPVLSTQVGGIARLNANSPCVTLVLPEDSEALAAKMTTLMLDTELRNTLAENARQCVLRTYSAEASASAYYTLYNKSGIAAC